MYMWIYIEPYYRHASKQLRYDKVLHKAFHTCRQQEPYLPLLPDAEHHHPLAGTYFPSCWPHLGPAAVE